MSRRGMKWDRRNPRGYEAASPRREEVPLRGGSHVAPGKVKRWADMTPAERAAVATSAAPPRAEAKPWTVERTPTGATLKVRASCRHEDERRFPTVAEAETAGPVVMKQPCWACAIGFATPEKDETP